MLLQGAADRYKVQDSLKGGRGVRTRKRPIKKRPEGTTNQAASAAGQGGRHGRRGGANGCSRASPRDVGRAGWTGEDAQGRLLACPGRENLFKLSPRPVRGPVADPLGSQRSVVKRTGRGGRHDRARSARISARLAAFTPSKLSTINSHQHPAGGVISNHVKKRPEGVTNAAAYGCRARRPNRPKRWREQVKPGRITTR